MTRDRVSWKLLKAVQFLDRFHGRPVSLSALRFQVPPGVQVLRKGDGIAAFVMDMNRGNDTEKGSELKAAVEGSCFLEEIFPLSGGNEKLEKIWLYPGNAYPAPSGSCRLYGNCMKGIRLRLTLSEDLNGMRLVEDYKKGSGICALYHPGERSAEGRIFLVSEGRKQEFIVCGAMESSFPDGGVYRLANPLKSGYSRGSALLETAYETRGTTDGSYMLLLNRPPAKERQLKIWTEKTEESWKAVKFSWGTAENRRLDLVPEEGGE